MENRSVGESVGGRCEQEAVVEGVWGVWELNLIVVMVTHIQTGVKPIPNVKIKIKAKQKFRGTNKKHQ